MISIRHRRQVKRAVRQLFHGFGFTMGALFFAITVYLMLAGPGFIQRGNDFRELARLPSYGEKR